MAFRVTRARIDNANPIPGKGGLVVLEYRPAQLEETATPPERVARTVALLRRRGYALPPQRLGAICIGGQIPEADVRRVVASSPELLIAHGLVIERDRVPRVDEILGRARGHHAASAAYVDM